MADLSDLYARLEQNGTLTYAEAQRYNDLNRFIQRIYAQTTLLGTSNREIVLKLLEEGYDLSYSYMSYAIEYEAGVLLAGAIPNLPAILQQVWNNPITGLRLEPAQERNRRLLVSDINAAIERGLIDGETYGGIARNIKVAFKSSMERAMVIAHTETHRVKGRAEQDSSMNAHRQGVLMIKIWRNMADEKVREGKQANHVNMEGNTVSVDQPFIMKDNPENFGMAPGSIEGPNNGSQNINCRCYASRRVDRIQPQVPRQQVDATFDDWYEMKRGESNG